MSKGIKSNIIIVILLILTAGVITLGIKSDKKARAKDLTDAQKYEQKAASDAKKAKDDKKNEEKAQADKLDVYGKLKAKKNIKILVVGDSIGKSIGKTNDDSAWDNRLKKLIDSKYGINSTIQNISEESAIAYKGYIEVMKSDIKDFDIAVVCFGASDQYVATKEQFNSTYEAVIRQLKKKKPNAEIVTVLENTVKNKNYVDIIKDMSKNYGLDLMDGIAAYNETGMNENQLMADKQHPNDKGYEVYANAVYKIIEKNVEAKKTVGTELQKPLNSDIDSLDKFNLITKYDSNDGFEIKDGMAVKAKDDAEIDLKTSASMIGISYLDTKDGGQVRVYVNDNLVKTIDTSSDRDISKAKLIAMHSQGESNIKIKTHNKTVKILGVITN